MSLKSLHFWPNLTQFTRGVDRVAPVNISPLNKYHFSRVYTIATNYNLITFTLSAIVCSNSVLSFIVATTAFFESSNIQSTSSNSLPPYSNNTGLIKSNARNFNLKPLLRLPLLLYAHSRIQTSVLNRCSYTYF